MDEDLKMFRIGLWMLGGVILLTVVLQVCYRTQNRARDKIRAEIVLTQQEIAERQATFASYVRPEVLRNLVISTAPRIEGISFNKSVRIEEIHLRGGTE